MRHPVRSIPAALAATLIISACADRQEPAAPQGFDLQASTTASCGLIRDMTAQVRNYFPQPERRTAQETMRALDNACSSNDAGAALLHAASLLGSIELLLDVGRGGDPVTGAALARGLLACTRAPLCSTGADLPSADVVRLSMTHPQGMFAFRRGHESEPALARTAVRSGNSNDPAFLWVVELAQNSTWKTAKNTDVALILGWPTGNYARIGGAPGSPTQDNPLGSQYELRHWPAGGFASGLVKVGVCSQQPIGSGAFPGRALRMQRNATMLEERTLAYCSPDGIAPASSPRLASVASPLLALAGSVLPGTWFAADVDDRTIVRSPVVGGSPLDFSTFTLLAAVTQGSLAAEWFFPEDLRVGSEIFVRVTAYSGGGTLMENVPVRVYIANNSGAPGGAVLSGGTTAVTGQATAVASDQGSGTARIGPFSAGKAGGYTLCVELNGSFAGFTFTPACSPLFNVKN